MAKPTPKWLTYEQCGSNSLDLSDSYYGVNFLAEPSAREYLLSDPLRICSELLSLAGYWRNVDPRKNGTPPAQSLAEVHGPTERIPFRCFPPFVVTKGYRMESYDYEPFDAIWIYGGEIRLPEWKHDIYFPWLFNDFYIPKHVLIAETAGLLPDERPAGYAFWCERYVSLAHQPNAELREDCEALIELIDIDDETAAVQAELMECTFEPGEWDEAIAQHRRYLAWCKAVVEEGWDLFALNSSGWMHP